MISETWTEWEHHAQMRQPIPLCIEIRRSSPIFMLMALALFFGGLDMALVGVIPVPSHSPAIGLLIALTGIPLFLAGRGTVIDARTREVRNWWGWIHKPLLRHNTPFDAYASLEIHKKLGAKHGDPQIGRTVRYPVRLVTKRGRGQGLMACVWISEARQLADEIVRVMPVALRDESGEPAEDEARREEELAS